MTLQLAYIKEAYGWAPEFDEEVSDKCYDAILLLIPEDEREAGI